jgi:uncharacterized membrane protein YqjE
MGEDPPPQAGIFDSARKLGRTGVAVLRNRLELLSVELEEQKVRLVRLLILAGAAIFLANIALLTFSAVLVLLAGERARLGVLIALSVVYALGALWAVLALRKEMRSAPHPFQESVSELKKDTEWLHPPN